MRLLLMLLLIVLNINPAFGEELNLSINSDQLRALVKMVLKDLEPDIPYSDAAVELLILTAAVESNGGTFIKQINGPALGIFQMEPRTHDWMINRVIPEQFPSFIRHLGKFSSGMDLDLALTGNLVYQIVVARMYYWMQPFAMPKINLPPDQLQIIRLAEIWKQYWNTYKGAGEAGTAVRRYMIYGLGE